MREFSFIAFRLFDGLNEKMLQGYCELKALEVNRTYAYPAGAYDPSASGSGSGSASGSVRGSD